MGFAHRVVHIDGDVQVAHEALVLAYGENRIVEHLQHARCGKLVRFQALRFTQTQITSIARRDARLATLRGWRRVCA